MTYTEIENKQNELRTLRNDYTDKARECQKEIDMLELEKYDSSRLLGKIIKLKVEDGVKYFFVNKIERLYRGPRYTGPSLYIFYKNTYNYPYESINMFGAFGTVSTLDSINVENPKNCAFERFALNNEDEVSISWKESQNIKPLENAEEIKEIMKQISQDVNNIFY